MTKPANRPSVREEKAAALDDFVKAEVARLKALNEAKGARLRALRLARDEANPAVPRQSEHVKPASGKKLPRPSQTPC
jgi:hypothetical protein